MNERIKWFFIGAITYQAAHFIIALLTGKTLVEWAILIRAALGAWG